MTEELQRQEANMQGSTETLRQYAPSDVQDNAQRLGVTRKRRPAEHVYVFAYSALTSLGDENQTYERMLNGETGIRSFDVGNFRTRFAAPADIDLTKYYTEDQLRDMSLAAAYSDWLVRRTIHKVPNIVGDDGKLHPNVVRDRFGIYTGTGAGPVLEFIDAYKSAHSVKDAQGNEDLTKGSREIDSRMGRRVFAQDVAARPAMSIGAQGVSSCSTEACSTGLGNLVQLFRDIKAGWQDAGVGGGVEGVLGMHPLRFGYYPEVPVGIFAKMWATSDEKEDPQNASLAFGAKRKGFILGDGGGVVGLGSEYFIEEHKLTPIAEVLGADKGMDAHHPTDPLPERVAKILLTALVDEKNGKTYWPDLYTGHVTGTKVGDAKEADALEIAFRENAYDMWVIAPKRFLGHQLGGAGAVTAIITLMCMQNSKIPGMHIENLDPRFDKFKIPQTTLHLNINIAEAAAFGFGGLGSAMSFGKV